MGEGARFPGSSFAWYVGLVAPLVPLRGGGSTGVDTIDDVVDWTGGCVGEPKKRGEKEVSEKERFTIRKKMRVLASFPILCIIKSYATRGLLVALNLHHGPALNQK